MRTIILTAIALVSLACTASAQTINSNMTIGEMNKKTWYHVSYEKPAPSTLQQALVAERDMVGEKNIGWTMPGSGDVCTALKSVGLPCNYNTRMTLSLFLTLNGKGLFSAAGGTNPYHKEADKGSIDDGFVGQPKQNAMLAAAIRKNAKLFSKGDLTAEAVRNSWK